MFPRLVFLGFLAISAPASGQTDSYLEEEQQAYEDCIKLVYQNPDAALDTALTWRETGGGLPAQHCVALAYSELGDYEKAAEELEDMADDMRRGVGWNFAGTAAPAERGMLSEAYAQSGNAWMLAGDPVKAYDLFTLALGEAGAGTQNYADILVDRSISRAEAGDYTGAIDDIAAAQQITKESLSLYVLKASAYRALGNFEQAQVELDNAFRLNPENREALLERGNLRHETGDDDGARQDWLAYLRLYPDSAAAGDVRKNLENLDVNIEEEGGAEAPPEQNP